MLSVRNRSVRHLTLHADIRLQTSYIFNFACIYYSYILLYTYIVTYLILHVDINEVFVVKVLLRVAISSDLVEGKKRKRKREREKVDSERE